MSMLCKHQRIKPTCGNNILKYFKEDLSKNIFKQILLPSGIKIVVLAPHPDDFDAIAVTLKKFQKCGSNLSLAVISGAESGVEDSFMDDYQTKSKAEIREKEQISSCLFFGLQKDDITFLHLSEDNNGDPIDNPSNYEIIKNYLLNQSPDIIFLPHGNDTNMGHVRTYTMCKKVISETELQPILFLNRDPKTIKMRNDAYIVFNEDEAHWKGKLLKHHKSQHQRNLNQRGHGFDERVLAVNRQIAEELPEEFKYAEVFEIEVHIK